LTIAAAIRVASEDGRKAMLTIYRAMMALRFEQELMRRKHRGNSLVISRSQG